MAKIKLLSLAIIAIDRDKLLIIVHPIRKIINWCYQRSTCKTEGARRRRQPLRQEISAHCHPLLPDTLMPDIARHCQTLLDVTYCKILHLNSLGGIAPKRLLKHDFPKLA